MIQGTVLHESCQQYHPMSRSDEGDIADSLSEVLIPSITQAVCLVIISVLQKHNILPTNMILIKLKYFFSKF